MQLSEEQREVLIAVLMSEIADTREEICRTDLLEFKEGLKAKRNVMESVLYDLAGAPGAVPAQGAS